MKIERKIAIGYTIIVALIGGIVYTYLHEWRQMNRLEREVKEIHRLRQSVHEAYVHMLDLTMFGETILEWERADTMILPYFRPMECVFQARKSRQCEPDSSLG